jgi:decaprenyl-diphosphate synthase subunit 1
LFTRPNGTITIRIEAEHVRIKPITHVMMPAMSYLLRTSLRRAVSGSTCLLSRTTSIITQPPSMHLHEPPLVKAHVNSTTIESIVTPSTAAVSPFKLVENDLRTLYADIRDELWTQRPELRQIASYYFDAQGKAFRPMVVVLVARALNRHVHGRPDLLESQRVVAMVTEMIHTASLVHDDVIDMADTRRGKPSVNVLWGAKKAILAGDYILSRSAQMLARLRNDEVIHIISRVLLDLVQGEFMQLGANESSQDERFAHYIHKSFKKTASLIAYTCKAVALLSGGGKEFEEAAFQYGRNLGIAFQLVDDLLDFVASQAELGKPAAADLKLGLATAPVLFACDKFPELNLLVLRRFCEPGDVEKAYEAVMKVSTIAFSYIQSYSNHNETVDFFFRLFRVTESNTQENWREST